MGPLASTLLAISAGAVFMGANTYIGNAPNFMVRRSARSAASRCRASSATWRGRARSCCRCSPLSPHLVPVSRAHAFEPGDDRLQSRDGRRPVVLLQVEQELEAVGLLADDGALLARSS